VRAEGRVYFVDVDDVDWIEADGNGVLLHTSEGTHALRVALGRLADYLGPARFIRIHRSAVVNLDRVVEVVPWGHGDHVAVLRSGKRLRVSRTYKDALLALVH
ncbi:MAG: LytTR family DNA-binding domain-containing protein, partial [Gemmatimonadota bacterium]|jgi:two-component system LytT family response regulator